MKNLKNLVLVFLLTVSSLLGGTQSFYADTENTITVGTQEETGVIAWLEANNYKTNLINPEFKYVCIDFDNNYTDFSVNTYIDAYLIGVKCESDIDILLKDIYKSTKLGGGAYAHLFGIDLITDCDSFEYHIINLATNSESTTANVYYKATQKYISSNETTFSQSNSTYLVPKMIRNNMGLYENSFGNYSKEDFSQYTVFYSDLDIYADETLTAKVPGLYGLVREKDSSIIKDSTEYDAGTTITHDITIKSSIKCDTLIVLPKTIDLEGCTNKDFEIKVKGEISPSIKLVVSAPNEFEMIPESGGTPQTASVTLDGNFLSEDLDIDTYKSKTGTITFNTEDFGDYTGIMNFTIAVERVN